MLESTTVEIILYYLTQKAFLTAQPSTTVEIILYYLTIFQNEMEAGSTTVEIILYYLTSGRKSAINNIYNSRNYSILLNVLHAVQLILIYNSRNYSILLNIFSFKHRKHNLQQ